MISAAQRVSLLFENLSLEVRVTRFILIRHGQTRWNRVEKYRGRTHLALNETGRRQAEAVALSIKDLPIAAIYTSPLKRAVETANILSKYNGVPVQILGGLIDIDYGGWQGLSPKEVVKQDSELYTKWLERPHEVRFPDGESLGDIRSRVVAAVEELVPKHNNETVILVSHKVVGQVLICALLSLDDSHFWQLNQDVGSISIFEIKDTMATIILLNDNCHIKSLAAR